MTLTREARAECVDTEKFVVKVPSRTYYFKGTEKDSATEWVNAINSTILTYCTGGGKYY